MNKSLTLISQFWKVLDRKKSKNSINPQKLFTIRMFTRIIRYFWRFINFLKPNYGLSIFGIYLKKRNKDFTYKFCLYGYCGTFLADEIESISSPTVFLDIGANIGLFSLLAEKNENFVKIYAFEPDEKTIGYFMKNIEVNRAQRIELIPFAVSNEPGIHRLYLEEGHSGASSLKKTDRSVSSYEIERIDFNYLNAHLYIPSNTSIFIKIDVEGHELNVLETLVKWSNFKYVNKIFLEFDIFMSNVVEMSSFLTLHGFSSHLKIGTSTHWDELWLKSN